MFALVTGLSLAALGSTKRARIACLCVMSFACGGGGVLLQGHPSSELAQLATEVPLCRATGEVLESRKGLGTFARADELHCAGRVVPGGVLVLDADHAFPGSPFSAEGTLVPLGSSDFDRARHRAGAAAALGGHPHFARPRDPFRSLAYRLREDLVKAASVLPARESALLTGLTIGDTTAMSPADEDTYRVTGLSHIVAVSGSNIAIVVGSVLLILVRFPLFLRLFLAAITLALYVTIVGPDASVLRAAAMGVLALVALAFGRRHEVLSALAYALAALLVIRPEMIFSLGLQLSAASTAGLALWSGPLAAWIRPLPTPVAFPLAATVSAQAAVTPLLVHHFEQISLVGPLSNLLALPAVAAATLIGLSGGLAGALWPPLGEMVMHAAYPFVWWVVRVADLTSLPGWSSVQVPGAVAGALGAVVVVGALLALRRLAPGRVI